MGRLHVWNLNNTMQQTIDSMKYWLYHNDCGRNNRLRLRDRREQNDPKALDKSIFKKVKKEFKQCISE